MGANPRIEEEPLMKTATLADIPAFCCAHAQDAAAGTGCTVIVAPDGAVCGVDVRGGGPATRETDLLKPENMVQNVHAVVLSGGSAFGLEASCGVMDALSERGIGFELAGAHVPIVTGACLFDLLVGQNAHPDKAMGRAAAEAALSDGAGSHLAEGNVGAGTGASVGKMLGGEGAMKTGFGMAGARWGDLVCVALVAVNALGHVIGPDGRQVAGTRDGKGGIADPLETFERAMSAQAVAAEGPVANTTIGCILTNARLTKAQATKTASCAHDAYARAIKPVHTQNDGDTIFTLASCQIEADPDAVSILATEAMQKAVVRAATQAESAYGLPAAKDYGTC